MPRLLSEKALLPVLQVQRVDAEALFADAQERAWGEEAARHRGLVERIDALIASVRAGREQHHGQCRRASLSRARRRRPADHVHGSRRPGRREPQTFYRRVDLRSWRSSMSTAPEAAERAPSPRWLTAQLDQLRHAGS
ncbi:MAG TPA: hypothetical protein VMD59_18340 [Acidimicrobiales bacterium]|nr:hypothetical protein [Acidimicrobiales bacterium]